MEFKLDFAIPEAVLQTSHKDSIVLLGSCFSDEMSGKLSAAGFSVLANPFGTLFHPVALVNVLNASLDESTSVDVLERDGLFFSWDSAGRIYGHSEVELIERITKTRTTVKKAIGEADLLVITFGTAWGYRHADLDKLAGNCHKAPASTFTKELSLLQPMAENWMKLLDRLHAFNPELKVVFTVSPVRHKKDGLIENNRSKARLIELVHWLTEEAEVHYFPAYEILIDELRDYRFYAKDLIHPSEEAIQYIWERFQRFALTPEAQELGRRVVSIRQSLEHKSLHPGSTADQERLKRAEQRRDELLAAHPELAWDIS